MSDHLLTIDGLSPTGLAELLAVASYLKRRRTAGLPEHALAGKTLAMVFEKPSLRTRLSFETAMLELGGRAIYIRGEEIGIGKRESLQDIASVLGRYVQGIMARVFSHDSIQGFARWSGVPVVNGLCDRHHPCQALGDLLTIHEHCGRIAGLTVVFVGDGNNVARSLAQGCALAGARFVLACPAGYGFSAAERTALNVTEINNPAQAVVGADVIYTDVWTSMGQEAETAKRKHDFAGFQVNAALAAKAGQRVRLMHCLPAHRGEEISDDAMDHTDSVVYDQAENRLHAQKAVLRLLMAPDAADVIRAAKATGAG
jgi:ornithine carbamoyltransferase